MAKRSIAGRSHASAWAVTRAVTVVAQIRAAAHHESGAGRIIVEAARIENDRPRTRHCDAATVFIGMILIVAPFPDIASHVIQAVAIWREAADRRCCCKAVFSRVPEWKLTLPDVGS